MKKSLIKILAILTCLIAIILLYKTIIIIQKNNQIAIVKQSLPKFQFYTQDLKLFNYQKVLFNKPVCIFYYNAGCEYCQDEAKHLQQNIAHFNKIQILMISTNLPKETKRFEEEYRLNEYKNIIWVYDKDFSFYKWFGNTVTPSVFIYNDKHILLKEYRGEVKIQAILNNIYANKKG
jgi:peroxiredoxin